jgi:hypothetical protein
MAGWFDFVNGQTLPASRVQDYLMDQSVMVFADAAARTAALPSPTNGMVTYLTSEEKLYIAKSFAWVQVTDLNNLPSNRNAVINGGFDIWQRGTTFNNIGTLSYAADRFRNSKDGTATVNITQQTFTPGASPAPGYESQFFMRYEVSSWTSGDVYLRTLLEDVRTFAGKTVTLSFWAKSVGGSLITNALVLQNFGSGGSSAVSTALGAKNLSTSWSRFSYTFTVPSITGKTVGTSSALVVELFRFASVGTVDIWGVQLEAGSVATPFSRAATTLQGELAACQRYYYRQTSPTTGYNVFASGSASSTTQVLYTMKMPTTMRTTPTAVDFSTLAASDGPGLISVSSLSIANGTSDTVLLNAGLTGATQFRPYTLNANNSASAFVGLSAEL